MLSHKDNELMCRVGRDTPMGKALRRYWTPAMQSSDLPEPGGDPRRLVLMGDSFVAFRGEDGVIGILDEGCCHRGVSLALGRVEGCGIRCLYHGWKFAADGTLLEAPNVADPAFTKRVRAKSYPVREAGGLVWVYFGPKELEPPFPHYTWFDVAPSNRLNAYLVEDANYVQVIEALVDSSHLNILHADGLNRSANGDLKFAQSVQPISLDSAPRVEAEDTDFGFHYAALRPLDGNYEARITGFIAPYAVANPNGDLWMGVVPISDTRSIYFHVWWSDSDKFGEEPLASETLKFIGLDQEALVAFGMTYETIDNPDKPSIKNGFKQNRVAMRAGRSFAGFHSFTQEDSAVIMSSGALKDRSYENLCPADMAIARLYKMYLGIAKCGENGSDPVGLHVNPDYVVGTQGTVPEDGWQKMVPHRKRKKPSPGDPAIAA